MVLSKAKKISVVGNSGAGKSTLSKKLGKHLDIDVFSIDKIYWLSGWELRDKESFISAHDKWLDFNSWIIEGVGYWNEMEHRISESDIVIFMDVPIELCKERAGIRIQDERLSPNSNITEGCVYGEVTDRQMEVIDSFHHTLRPKLVNYLSGLGQGKVRVVSSFQELNIYSQM